MNNEEYVQVINELAKNIPVDFIDLEARRKRGVAPTVAFSDFITHSQQGNWAEEVLQDSINAAYDDLTAVKYGKGDDIIAGDPGFKEFYENYQDELDTIGKRPDLLIFDQETFVNEDIGLDICTKPAAEIHDLVSKSKAGLEVRSSAYLCGKFIPKKDKPTLSFTPKVEDIKVILKWINTFKVPHYYVQVFFDSVFIISFLDILRLLNTSTKITTGIKKKKVRGYQGEELVFEIQENPKNQFKATIHIFISSGKKISKGVEMPELIGVRKEVGGGRLLHYIGFKGGSIDLYSEDFLEYLNLDEMVISTF